MFSGTVPMTTFAQLWQPAGARDAAGIHEPQAPNQVWPLPYDQRCGGDRRHRLREGVRAAAGGRVNMARGEPADPSANGDRNGHAVGFGSLRRKEDARFIRGAERSSTTSSFRGCCTGSTAKPLPACPHRLDRCERSAAASPRHAVITGADLEARGAAWMRTMSLDVQAVLAVDKVRFQGQEVAFVIAEDRYSVRDALELIDVEYEPCPSWSTGACARRRRATDPGRPRR